MVNKKLVCSSPAFVFMASVLRRTLVLPVTIAANKTI